MIISRFTLNNERERVDIWYSDRESNPDQRFRKPTFYPLNYQSAFLSFALLLTSEEAITLVCKDRKKKLYIG